jgi:SAM-dependent methyltransferase
MPSRAWRKVRLGFATVRSRGHSLGIIGGELGYKILRTISPEQPSGMGGGSYAGRNKLEVLFGPQLWDEVEDKVVIDFGCGAGEEAIELAQRGSRHVYGIDISERWLSVARQRAAQKSCGNVTFSSTPLEPADLIISVDAFEHFADPGTILEAMAGLLKPTGYILASFGPTWYHPRGGHLFSIFPWAHLIFTESALCRWRSHIRSDGATKFAEVDGGLNQMTIRRFERIIAHSSLEIDTLEAVPIRAARFLHSDFTREFLTAIVRCRLSPAKRPEY